MQGGKGGGRSLAPRLPPPEFDLQFILKPDQPLASHGSMLRRLYVDGFFCDAPTTMIIVHHSSLIQPFRPVLVVVILDGKVAGSIVRLCKRVPEQQSQEEGCRFRCFIRCEKVFKKRQ